MRVQGIEPEVCGGPELAFPAFPKLAGIYSEGITVVVPGNPWRDDVVLQRFNRRFFLSYGEPPDVIAAYSYDGMNFLIQAIQAAGLNRARIRDAMAEIKVFHGVTGEMRFDGSGSNISPPVLAVVRDGRFVPLSRP
jgi:branched-chain amino acid transport system substrate-binding protein